MSIAKETTNDIPATSVGTVRAWRTGVLNPQNLPVLMLDTNEGLSLTVAMTPETAIGLAESLKRDGETTHKSAEAI